jgi:magnesium chelatase family protein
LARLSGPLLDRLDIHTLVPPVAIGALTEPSPKSDDYAIRARVLAARTTQRERFERGLTRAAVNAELSLAELEQLGKNQTEVAELLSHAVERLGLSARAFVKVLRVARTIADLEGKHAIQRAHLAEAIQGRLLEPHALKQVT